MPATWAVPGILLLLLAQTACPDVVELNNGNRVEGEVVEETEASVTVQLPAGKVVLDRSRIVSIRYALPFKEALRNEESRMDPGDAAARTTLATECVRRNRIDDAIRLYREALDIDPALAEAKSRILRIVESRVQRLLASIDRLIGDEEAHAALGEIRSIEVLYPEYRQVREIQSRRGAIHEDLRQWPEALQAWDGWLQAEPKAAEPMKGRLRALVALNRKAEAAEAFRNLAASSQEPDAGEYKARAEAMSALAELEPRGEELTAEDLLRLARARARLGDLAGAFTASRVAVTRAPDNLDVLRLYVTLGVKTGAGAELIQAISRAARSEPSLASELQHLQLQARYGNTITLQQVGSLERLGQLEGLVEDYLADRDRDRRKSILDSIQTFQDLPISVLEAVVRVPHRVPALVIDPAGACKLTGENGDVPLEKLQSAGHVRVFRLEHAVPGEVKPAELYVAVPEDYTREKRMGLLIGLHGAGGVGLHSALTWGKLAGKHDLIVASPSADPRWGFGASSYSQRQILAVRRWALESFNIDPNRVFITGAATGGQATWFMATHYPDSFGAAAPLLGSPQDTTDVLENLIHVPIHITIGGKDRFVPVNPVRAAVARLRKLGYRHEFVLHSDREHQVEFRDLADSVQWMMSSPRTPCPSKVLFVSSQLRHHRAYWVEITERVEKNVETVSVLHPLTQEETEQVKVSRDPARVEAEIDGNTIRVTTANVRSLRLLLNDRMVDLSRPVVVRLNGLEVFRKTVSRSWSFLLEKARLLDREMLFATEIVLEVP